MEARVYEVESKEQAKLKKILDADPYSEKSFSRVGYKLKEGKTLGADAAKYYLYFKAEADFFKFAEEKFKEVASVKRAQNETEEKIIASIQEEENAAEAGFGSMFG
ncbi:MAG: hypothetical protein ABIH99_05155 [Candidatus Micrarchaeota archaeon]